MCTHTHLNAAGTYATWFASQASESSQSNPNLVSNPNANSNLLMTVLGYVVAALTDPSLCLQAALAMRNLCDANRKALAPQMGAFAELYAGLGSIPVCLSFFPFSVRTQS